MIYYLTFLDDNETIKFDNQEAYYLRIADLRSKGYNIQYEKGEKSCYVSK